MTRPKPSSEPRRRRRLLTLKAGAAELSIGLRTMKALVASGAMPVIRVSPGRIAIDPQDLDRYVQSRRSVS